MHIEIVFCSNQLEQIECIGDTSPMLFSRVISQKRKNGIRPKNEDPIPFKHESL